MAQRLKTDRILFFTVVIMLSAGLLFVYSASSIMAELKGRSPWSFLLQQAVAAAVGVPVMMLLKNTSYRKLRHPAVAFTAVGIALILLGIVYFADSAHHRWLRIGPAGLQPSEIAKPALVLFLAYFVAWRSSAINTRYTLMPVAMTVGLVVLAVIVADLGTAVVLAATTAVVFLVAGLEWRYCLVAASVAMVGVVFFIAQKPYRVARIVGYLDPEFRIIGQFDPQERLKTYLQKSLTSRDTSYQADQSKIAVGAGGVFGQGLMQGRQKLLYLPEAHTDFIYAVVAEELGLIGAGLLLLGFLVIFWRGLRASVLIPDEFGAYLALGISTCIVVQAMMNMSVVLGMAPTKGIPLPLISSGGSSLVSTLASLGMLMNISEHAG
ncbi:MAG: FtsW/RodA/SpoVE family cell cycle protein [Bryobacteraceae bacterium]